MKTQAKTIKMKVIYNIYHQADAFCPETTTTENDVSIIISHFSFCPFAL